MVVAAAQQMPIIQMELKNHARPIQMIYQHRIGPAGQSIKAIDVLQISLTSSY